MKNLISIITALFYSVSLYCANVVPQETPVKFEIHYSEKGVKAKSIQIIKDKVAFVMQDIYF